MTTRHSPPRVLKQQADHIAAKLKAAESSGAPHTRESITFGVVMDDKVIRIEMTWSTIRDTTKAGIAEYILNQMREVRETQQ